MGDLERKKRIRNYIRIAIGIVVLIFVILLIINWDSFAAGFAEGYNSVRR